MKVSLATLFTAASLACVASAAPVAPSGGQFSALTLNVAGLPGIISSGNPEKNTAVMGQRIANFDLVNVQEDFNYHATLYANDKHPHRTPTSGGVPFGSGLNTLSNLPYIDFQRIKWKTCANASGADCLTPKGFTFMRVRLAEGVYIDVYNLHTDAGSDAADLSARASNLAQVSDFIHSNSIGNAILVMGDTNTRYTRAGDTILEFAQRSGLTDAWVQTILRGVPPKKGAPAIVCADPPTDTCEVVDKFLYRGNTVVNLNAVGYMNQNAAFLDEQGKPLSDHYPLSADFKYTLSDSVRMSDTLGGPHGNYFSMLPSTSKTSAVRSLTLRGGSRLDGVSMTRTDGQTFTYGGNGGSASTLDLAADEHLTSVTLTQGKKSDKTRVFSARFTTNKGRSVAVGSPTKEAATYNAPAGWRIAGLWGRAGEEVDRLGVIYTLI
ncbi:endonuclease/exonuclease/phosphatase [Powellomyces hirtus]|nr:endonuclease/exonuclease/phosphatase [Powellomyces hirtus]